jgi:von Willebrand factor type A domain
LDAQISAVIAVLQTIANLPGLGNDNVVIGLTTFSTQAKYHGMFAPCDPKDASKINPDILKLLTSLRSDGYTHFDDALDKVIDFFQEAPKNRNNILMFLSDGIPNVVGDGDKEEPTSIYRDNQPGALEYGSELTALDAMKVKRIAVGVGSGSDVRPGFGLDMIDNTPDPYTGKKPTLATNSDILKGALLNNPTAGDVIEFAILVNGNPVEFIDASQVKPGPTGFSFGTFVLNGVNPSHGVINEITAIATVDYDGMQATVDDQVLFKVTNLVPGTLFV